ncbi:MAG: SdpI family protein [Bacteroidetes bacterium]|nr:SdpI family protein [Bacteroidota bacterium]
MGNPIFIIPFMVGSIMIILGIVLITHPPKKMNNLYGYRTASSLKNQEQWDFAQKYCGNELIRLGILMTISSTIGLFFELNVGLALIIGLGIMLFFMIIIILRVERAISRNFY